MRSLGRGASFVYVIVAYVIATAVAYGVAAAMGDESPLVTALVADLVATVVIFVAGTIADNGSLYDAYWSVAPPLIAWYWLATAESTANGTRQALALIVVVVWAIRLTSNWARDWPGLEHEDWRYTNLYENGPKHVMRLTSVMLFPTLIVFVGLLPLRSALSEGSNDVGVLDWLALLVGIGASVIEYVADEQMRRFGRTKQPGEIMQTGLWRYSRHPNYFGELAFWVSLWLFGLAADAGWWWTVIGPLAMLAMFVFASIPMLDDRSRERRPAFAAYEARTSALIPLPPKRT
ncbi:MAG TPA: DUF1295 domain-containing protein [Acidimicrobiales bacterium]|nr:DUF1295 domain-containing protein [Acidimicrobiales bacterium]